MRWRKKMAAELTEEERQRKLREYEKEATTERREAEKEHRFIRQRDIEEKKWRERREREKVIAAHREYQKGRGELPSQKAKQQLRRGKKWVGRRVEEYKEARPSRKEWRELAKEERIALIKARTKGRAKGLELREKYKVSGKLYVPTRGRYKGMPIPTGGYIPPPPRRVGIQKAVSGYTRYDPVSGQYIKVRSYPRTYAAPPEVEETPEAPSPKGGLMDIDVFGMGQMLPPLQAPQTPKKKKKASPQNTDELIGSMLGL